MDNYSRTFERNILAEFTFKYGVGLKAESYEYRPHGWVEDYHDEPSKELNFDEKK